MNQLVKVNYDNPNKPTVLGRDLHKALEIKTRYNDWFARMCEYGFVEGKDYCTFLSKTNEGGRPSTDHQLTIDMAKELCMIQRNEKGKEFRKYFIEAENAWNSPEKIFARALHLAQEQMDDVINKKYRIE